MSIAALKVRIRHLLDLKAWPEAARALRELVVAEPRLASAWIELSYVESLLGHYRAAAEAARIASRIPSLETSEQLDLLSRLRTFNDGPAVRGMASAILASPVPDVQVLLACAGQLSNLNDHAASLDCANLAVSRDPVSIAPRLIRGQVLMQHGELQAAEQDLEWCVTRAPGLAPAWWGLARLRKQTSHSNHVAAIRRVVARDGLRAADVCYACFALHKELDDLGDHAGAWEALDQACRAKRGTLKYDPADSQRLFEALEAWRPPTEPPPMPVAGAKAPVFIVGMHRSGTTLLEQLLDASPQVRGVGELYDFTSAMRFATDHHCRGVIDRTIVERARDVDFDEVGRRYLAGMAWRLGDEPLFTDKLPSNFLNIGFICRALPQARILHMVRDPLETCFSNLRELFSDANPYSYDQAELADYFIRYRRLMAHWHALFPGRILDVDYGELTRDPETVMRRVAAFCGIDYVPGMRDPRSSTRAVATASAVQVREGVVRRETPKWAPYARQLQPLADALRAGGIALPGI